MTKRERNRHETFPCPNCGADVPTGRLSCPECGSDDATGWSEDADVWRADVPTGYAKDDEFDYEEFVAREFEGKTRKILGIPVGVFYLLVFGLIVGLLLLALG